MSNMATRARLGNEAEVNESLDQPLLFTVATLLMLGLIMVYSASIGLGDAQAPSTAQVTQQALYLMLGLSLMVCTAFIPVNLWHRLSMPLLVVALVALIAVMFIGAELNGSRRWILLGGFSAQPAEYAKLALVIYAASYLTRRHAELQTFSKGVFNIAAVLAVFGGLLLAQPDFGSFVVLTATVGLMLFLSGIRVWHTLLCVGVAGVAMFFMISLSEYRMARLLSFRDPWADPFDSGFQLTQALIAIGRGEIFGVGLGASIQKLYYLPHANNDFIYAVIGEELGLFGLTLVMVLFAFLLLRVLRISRAAELAGRVFSARLAQGVAFLLVFQAMINMGVNLGSLPTKGLTLPLISYGGSSLLVSCVAIGLVFAVDRQTRLSGVSSLGRGGRGRRSA